MPIRHSRHSQARRVARDGAQARQPPGERRGRRMRWSAVLLLLALVSAAFVAPVGQARGARERSPEEEAAKQTEREERIAARRGRRASERAARQSQGESEGAPAGARRKPGGPTDTGKKDGTVVTVTCTQVTWEFAGFANKPHNTVTGVVTLRDRRPPGKLPQTFIFDGPTSTQTTEIHPLPGHYLVDAQAHWNTNGHKGGFDIHINKQCAADPELSIEKLQQVGGGAFTSSPLAGGVGQSVGYEMIVRNTGNVPLTLGSLDDPQCDAGTLTGPSDPTLEIGASATYLCKHLLNGQDRVAGSYANTAMITGTPPEGDGAPTTRTSNTVVVTVSAVAPPPAPAPSFSIEKLQRIVGGYTAAPLNGSVGQRVEYKIVVKNTGNVTLTLEAFSDPRCDPGTITGPPSATLAVATSVSYLCTHVLSSRDQAAGSYANTATITGTPPTGEGAPITHTSNTVVVTVTAGKSSPPGTNNPGAPTGSVGVSASSTSVTGSPQSGVLGTAAVGVPALSGPQGCVRSSFHVSIKSTGVQSVTFYLDGHKLKTLTAKNARKGRLTILINPAKLKLGAHKLLARITMAAHGASTKARQASRSITILRCSSAVGTPKFTG
jgi:uncharacterized repeat protein (TIGR01451 family)